MNYKKVLILCALCISVCGMSVSASESETAESETVSSETSFPLTIEHAFGETIIESKPDRIAAVGWENQGTPLALGVAPVGVSTANYGLVTENNLHPWTDEAFKELGVDYLIEGGQTMNPSTEDMLTAIEKVNAKNIFILPNNKNIILAANQAKAMTEDKNIIVVPTKTVPQGITAMISYVPEKSAEENEEAMTEGIQMVKTGQVTYAVRDTHIDEKEIHQGDIMGLGDHGLLAVGQDILTVAEETIRAMVDEDSELISIYYGEDMSEEDAESLGEKIEQAYPDCDVEVNYGGQPIYYCVVSVE